MRVDGASGDRASVVNGVFALEEALYNGRALYRKVGDPHCWLRFAPNRTWTISNTVDKDANNNAGDAFSSSFGLSLPTDSSVWEVFVDGKLVKQAAMRVQPASEQVGARLGARVSVSQRAGVVAIALVRSRIFCWCIFLYVRVCVCGSPWRTAPRFGPAGAFRSCERVCLTVRMHECADVDVC